MFEDVAQSRTARFRFRLICSFGQFQEIVGTLRAKSHLEPVENKSGSIGDLGIP